METLPFELNNNILNNIVFNTLELSNLIGLTVIVILLISSALVSGSEVAFFSLSPANLDNLKTKNTKKGNEVLNLLKKPEHLLATILITNNFVNVGIIVLSSFLTDSMINFSDTPAWVPFLFTIVIVTFLLLLFGEIIPKVYAAKYSETFSLLMSVPLSFLNILFKPISFLLVSSTSLVNKRLMKRKPEISLDDLSNAIDLAENEIKENKKILEGIVSYGSIDASEIMKPRVDVIAFDISTSYSKLIERIKKHNYSSIFLRLIS